MKNRLLTDFIRFVRNLLIFCEIFFTLHCCQHRECSAAQFFSEAFHMFQYEKRVCTFAIETASFILLEFVVSFVRLLLADSLEY